MIEEEWSLSIEILERIMAYQLPQKLPLALLVGMTRLTSIPDILDRYRLAITSAKQKILLQVEIGNQDFGNIPRW